jgi:hypothetical protein
MELPASPALAQPPIQNETQSVKMGVAFVVATMLATLPPSKKKTFLYSV